jgi:CRP-like cAMP-binding protein
MNYLFNDTERITNAYCCEDTHLMVFDKNAFEKIKKFQRERIVTYKVNFMRSIHQFSSFPSGRLKSLIHKLRIEHRIRGAYLFKEGMPADKVYLIKEGDFQVTKKVI